MSHTHRHPKELMRRQPDCHVNYVVTWPLPEPVDGISYELLSTGQLYRAIDALKEKSGGELRFKRFNHKGKSVSRRVRSVHWMGAGLALLAHYRGPATVVSLGDLERVGRQDEEVELATVYTHSA